MLNSGLRRYGCMQNVLRFSRFFRCVPARHTASSRRRAAPLRRDSVKCAATSNTNASRRTIFDDLRRAYYSAVNDGIAVLVFDNRNESVNKFNRITLEELRAAVDTLKG